MDKEVARVGPRSAEDVVVVAKAQTGMLVQGEDQPTCEKVPLTRKEVAVSMRLWDVVDHYRWCSPSERRTACEFEDLAEAGL